jgi:hypothetical protein
MINDLLGSHTAMEFERISNGITNAIIGERKRAAPNAGCFFANSVMQFQGPQA